MMPSKYFLPKFLLPKFLERVYIPIAKSQCGYVSTPMNSMKFDLLEQKRTFSGSKFTKI